MQGSQGQVGPLGEKGKTLKLELYKTILVSQDFNSMSAKQLFSVNKFTASLDLVWVSLCIIIIFSCLQICINKINK